MILAYLTTALDSHAWTNMTIYEYPLRHLFDKISASRFYAALTYLPAIPPTS